METEQNISSEKKKLTLGHHLAFGTLEFLVAATAIGGIVDEKYNDGKIFKEIRMYLGTDIETQRQKIWHQKMLDGCELYIGSFDPESKQIVLKPYNPEENYSSPQQGDPI